MIHHVSIPARDPQHVVRDPAELIGGKCMPFGPLAGAYMAMSGDPHSTDRGVPRAHDARYPRER
jgi:hypothetical protein